MPGLLHHEGGGGEGGKSGKRKQDLIIAGTFALVIIAWLTLKHMQAGAAGTGTTEGVTGSATQVAPGGASGGLSPDLTGLQDQINSLSGIVANLRIPGTTPGDTTPGATDTTGGGLPIAPKPTTGGTPAKPTLASGYGWFDTFKQTFTAQSVAQRFGLTVDQLKTLNPSLGIKTGSSVIGTNVDVKVRENAASFNQAAYNKVNPGAAKTGIAATSHPTVPVKAAVPPKPKHPVQKG